MRIFAASLVLLSTFAVVQLASGALFQPERITGDTTGRKSSHKIWDDRVVWLDFRSGSPGMYQYRFSTGTETRFMEIKLGTDFRGEVLSYNGGVPQTYNLGTGTTYNLSSQSGTFIYTSLGSHWAAWSASSASLQYDVYARRIQTNGCPVGPVVHVTSEGGIETEVATDGEYVAWADRSGSNTGVWLRNMLTGDTQRLGAGDYPAVQGNHVAWDGNGVWVHDIATGSSTQISIVGAVENPGLWDDQVVWINGGRLYGYSTSSGDRFVFDLPTRPGYTTPDSWSPSIYEDVVVWAQRQKPLAGGDYVCSLYAMEIPEPATVALLAAGLGALLVRKRRG